uniref:Uncharacterized protein n=1 Tax=Arundo donax TaxID=35708 RepID=A0A0A8ZHQ0_ARUDO
MALKNYLPQNTRGETMVLNYHQ